MVISGNESVNLGISDRKRNAASLSGIIGVFFSHLSMMAVTLMAIGLR